MNAEEEFEKYWDDPSHQDKYPSWHDREVAQDAFLSALAIGRNSVEESITNNSFGQHHYQRGYADGRKAGLKEALEIAASREIEHCKTHRDEIVNNTACCISDDILFRIEEIKL